MRILVVLLTLGAMTGCSAVTLRCGVQEEGSSYVELVNVPVDLTRQAETYAKLCGFAYEQTEGDKS